MLGGMYKDVEINPEKMSDLGDIASLQTGEYNADSGVDKMGKVTTVSGAVARAAKPIVDKLSKDFPKWGWSPRLQGATNNLIKFDRMVNMGQFIDDFATPVDQFSEGGHKIHIKKENRGKFTALKKRTGHSASWFKAHGTHAQKKMAVFALNSRHWGKKKAHGGVKF